MADGEYAVHYSSLKGNTRTVPYCTVFGSLEDAEAYAQHQVEQTPTLRCTIYDHHGFVGAPLREVRGAEFRDGEMSARLRRWLGSVLFFGGLILVLIDWVDDFRLSWPALIGSRMLIPGVILLFTEAMILLQERSNRRQAAAKEGA